MTSMTSGWGQHGYEVAFDWGATGAAQVMSAGAILVVVDVLSFSSSVCVAVERGTAVYPTFWRDERAAELAARVGAVLAVGRREATPESPWSLSPTALRSAEVIPRLVLPSPNGSAIAAVEREATVIAACLRNADAVGEWVVRQLPERKRVCVIAAGERWPDESLRPALEDALGARTERRRLRRRRIHRARTEQQCSRSRVVARCVPRSDELTARMDSGYGDPLVMRIESAVRQSAAEQARIA